MSCDEFLYLFGEGFFFIVYIWIILLGRLLGLIIDYL